VRALERDGKLPPHLKPGERNKRIYFYLLWGCGRALNAAPTPCPRQC
jgi:hypothetical protein